MLTDRHAAVLPAGVFLSRHVPFTCPEYVVTMPNMYARGILFGKMVLELGDTCTVRNDAQDFYADLEFKTKGFFTGTYNSIAGRVKRGSTELGDVTGKWSALMEFKPSKVSYCQAKLTFPSRDVTCLTPKIILDGGETHVIRRAEERS